MLWIVRYFDFVFSSVLSCYTEDTVGASMVGFGIFSLAVWLALTEWVRDWSSLSTAELCAVMILTICLFWFCLGIFMFPCDASAPSQFSVAWFSHTDALNMDSKWYCTTTPLLTSDLLSLKI